MYHPRIRVGDGRVLQLRVAVQGIEPLIWRRLVVSERASLRELHTIVEQAMGRDGDDSHSFRVDGVRFRDSDDDPAPGHATETVALDDLELHPGAVLEHRAETPVAAWMHWITLEQMMPRLVGQRLPACIAAGRAAPPVECSGPADYGALLASWHDPLDPRSAELRSWLADDFDPGYADVTAINARLARVKKHRPAA
jgi:hypothetical protein